MGLIRKTKKTSKKNKYLAFIIEMKSSSLPDELSATAVAVNDAVDNQTAQAAKEVAGPPKVVENVWKRAQISTAIIPQKVIPVKNTSKVTKKVSGENNKNGKTQSLKVEKVSKQDEDIPRIVEEIATDNVAEKVDLSGNVVDPVVEVVPLVETILLDTADPMPFNGVWKRKALFEPKSNLSSDFEQSLDVVWVQAKSGIYVDIRTPPVAGAASSHDKRTIKSFAGKATFDHATTHLTWNRAVDYRAIPSQDVGAVSLPVSGAGRELVEDSVLPGDDYREIWEKVKRERVLKPAASSAISKEGDSADGKESAGVDPLDKAEAKPAKSWSAVVAPKVTAVPVAKKTAAAVEKKAPSELACILTRKTGPAPHSQSVSSDVVAKKPSVKNLSTAKKLSPAALRNAEKKAVKTPSATIEPAAAIEAKVASVDAAEDVKSAEEAGYFLIVDGHFALTASLHSHHVPTFTPTEIELRDYFERKTAPPTIAPVAVVEQVAAAPVVVEAKPSTWAQLAQKALPVVVAAPPSSAPRTGKRASATVAQIEQYLSQYVTVVGDVHTWTVLYSLEASHVGKNLSEIEVALGAGRVKVTDLFKRFSWKVVNGILPKVVTKNL